MAPDLPFSMQLELTSHCNLRCVMCPLTTGTSSTSSSVGHVSEDTWERILPVARRCQQVFIAGYGEPLTNPRCLELLRDLDAHGVLTSIATNGLVLSPAIASGLATLDHLAEVNVSIDSPDPDVYHQLRGGNLDRALRGLAALVDALHPGQVSVSSVLMQTNAASLVAFPAVLAGLGVRHYCLGGVMDYNEFAAASTLLGRVELRDVVAAIRDECERHDVYLVVGSEDRLRLELDDPAAARDRYHDHPGADPAVTRQCMVPWEVPFVDKDGTVFACCYAGSANERPLGNVHDAPLESIWVDVPFQRFRADITDGRTVPDVCARCTVVPLGEHPLRTWAAELVPGSLVVDRDHVGVQFRNVGTRTWRPEDLVRLGTRSGDGAIAHPSWLFPQRAATFCEPEVAPGELATFEFDVVPQRAPVVERFHLVVEGVLWLPGVAVDVTVPARSPLRRRRLPAPPDPPIAGLAAEIVDVVVEATTVRVRARNVGMRGWTPGDAVRVGTASPRDMASPFAQPSWLQPNRACTFTETSVPPGAVATFSFELPAEAHGAQQLQLVADGFCWLRGTEFTVSA